jgi:uncharacterized protein (TIGR03067 family)
MRHILLLLVGCLSLAFAPAPFPKAVRTRDARADLQALQGTWERTELYSWGERIHETPGHVTLVVTGDSATFFSGGNGQTNWTIVLDSSRRPAEIDLRRRGYSEPYVLRGVYRLEGDTFTVCYRGHGDDRPTDFDRDREKKVYFTVYKRKSR